MALEVLRFSVAHVLRRMRLCLITLLALAHCDINFTHFSRDPSGKLSHLRLLGGSRVDYFSTEFNELCEETTPAIRPQVGMTQRFQHPEMRDDPNFADLPEYRYLDDTQLDNPNAGRISHGKHTEVVVTNAFIPDDDLLPLPHNRTHLCHYALRLTPPENMKNTAAWYRFKQLVAYGFVTEFHFRILHRQKECLEAGKALQYCPYSEAWCEGWCQEAGGDGFAFVIQNFGRKAVGSQVNGMGYGFKYNLAIEFDTLRNSDFEEISGNHISVHMPASEEQANTANHYLAEIAHSDDIPALSDGTHVVRIEYDPRFYSWDDLGRSFESDNTRSFVSDMTSGRVGLLTVEFDGRRVITLPLDINRIARIDNMVNYQAAPPVAPDPSAYDEGGGSPGRAWVGFTSSTSYSHWQSVDILSWTFTEKPRCPNSGAPPDSHLSGPSAFPLTSPHRSGDLDVMCRVDKGTVNPTKCTRFGDPLCSLLVRNIARQPVKMSVRMRWDKPFESWACENGILEWDMLHPYFLGCRRAVYYTYDLADLQFITLDGTRSIQVNDPIFLGKTPAPFVRKSKFEYCLMEHKFDLLRLYIAECNCEFCVRLLTLQQNYAVFFNDRCTVRYGLICPCFEASEVAPDSSSWSRAEPLKNMRLHICRGCVYPSHCSQMLKVATCEKPPYQTYVVGNPVAPVPLRAGFQNLSRDSGRVLDGRLSGDACNCEPSVRPYRGDPNGRKGLCEDSQELDRVNVPELDNCAMKCSNTPKCGFLIFWDDGDCRVYMTCPWVICTTLRCTLAGVYRMAPLGPYIDTRGEVQKFSVYPVRTIQTTKESCFGCLHLYDDIHCVAECGPGLKVPYLHWPGGQSCATCIFAGNRLHELTLQQTKDVKACVYEATRKGQDPWAQCNETVTRTAEVPSYDLFNGVNTHFLSECPGRTYKEVGAVCVPNVLAVDHFPSQVLSRMAAINDTVWTKDLECLNAVCHVVPRHTCYKRLARWSFNLDFQGFMAASTENRVNGTIGGKGFSGQGFNAPYVREEEGVLKVDKHQKQYVVSDPLPFALENNTLEAWIEIDAAEGVKDLAVGRVVEADTNWEEDYSSRFAVDGDMTTYWSSQLGEIGNLELSAVWRMRMPGLSSVDGAYIYWFQPASEFHLQISVEDVSTYEETTTWTEILHITGNDETTTYIPLFFQARWVRLIMVTASTIRMSDPGKDRPVYSIYEVETLTDMVLSRLKPTVTEYKWNLSVDLASDGDKDTFWATMPGDQNASLYFDFGSLQTDISVIVLKWRFTPMEFTLWIGRQPCKQERPSRRLFSFSGAAVLPVQSDFTLWDGQCLLIEIDQVRHVWGEYLSGLFEVEVHRESTNLAVTATVAETDPPESPTAHLTAVSGALDGNPATYWMVQPKTAGKASLTLDLGGEPLVMAVRVRWATVAGFGYYASVFSVSVGTSFADLEQVDYVSGNFQNTHRVVIYKYVRYVKLTVLGVMFSNPGGKVAVEDLVVHVASANMASMPATTAIATSQWANCPSCSVSYDGANRIHGSHQAADGDVSTWWGLPLGMTREVDDTVVWTVTFDIPMIINLVIVRWRYPAESLTVWCAFNVSSRFSPVGFLVDNTDYLTPVVFSAPRTCRVIMLVVSTPLEKFAGQGIIGVQEVEIYSTANNLALNKPVAASDGSTDIGLSNDASDQSKWLSGGAAPINVTYDLGVVVDGWCVRTLWSSGLSGRGFDIAISLDGIEYRTLVKYNNNLDRDVYSVHFFTARYVKLLLRTTQIGAWAYSLRTLAVYGSVNLARGKPTIASRSWNHTGLEACDGIDTTFWVAEPLSTSSTVRVDLQRDFFVGDGVRILWKFPAMDFVVMYGLNTSVWDLLYEVQGNLNYYTEIQKNFVGRYVEIRMTKPSLLNGDGSYAIYSFDVLFDPNLAHGKVSVATQTIQSSNFRARNAIDQQPSTIWMPPQNTDDGYIIIDLLGDYVVSRFMAHWRHAPRTYQLYGQHVVTLQYILIKTYTAAQYDFRVPLTQVYEEGFVARRLKLQIIEVADTGEGKLCSLRDVLLHTYLNINKALRARVEFSDEISGNPASFATDGNRRGTYWTPGEGIRKAWLHIFVTDCQTPMTVARTSVWWRYPPGSYMIEFYADVVQGWFEVYSAVDQTALFTDFFKYRKMCEMKIHIYDKPVPLTHDIGLFDLSVYGAKPFVPPAVGPEPKIWEASVSNVNDLDEGTYWMAPPYLNLGAVQKVDIYLDLGQSYNVFDIFIWFSMLSQGFAVWVSTVGFEIDEFEKRMTSTSVWGRMRLETRGVAFKARYLRVDIFKSFQDEENQLGTSIRDIAVYQFRNLAQSAPTSSDTIWSYPAAWVTDSSASSYWMSKFNAQTAALIIDLGASYNVGGITGELEHICSYYRFDYSLDKLTWKRAFQTGNNKGRTIDISPKLYHFNGRYIRIFMSQSKGLIYHPDQPEVKLGRGYVFGLRSIQIWEHTGGGGAVSIQNLDGTEFNSIVWGQRQPGEWMLGSESDVFTQDFDGGTFKEDQGNPAHIVVTFRKVASTNPLEKMQEIAFYRNGISYGKAYQKSVNPDRLAHPNQTRLVLGVRSTIFANESGTISQADLDNIAGVHSLTHSPYFFGKIYNVTLIQNALSPEEVAGLYNVVRGGEELGCHCFDACPVGYNRWNRKVPVPCSGQGACLRNEEGIPLGIGKCECLPGYSGLNCEKHCSELSVWGCCEIDDDCPQNYVCEKKTKACTTEASLGNGEGFHYY